MGAGFAAGLQALLASVQRYSVASEPEELRLAAVDAIASSGASAPALMFHLRTDRHDLHREGGDQE